MVAVAERVIAGGNGTDESAWQLWLAQLNVPTVVANDLVPEGSRIVFVSPHPDDEVLAAGGLLAQTTALGRPGCVVAVTDGTASHAGSSLWTEKALARQRAMETTRALKALRASPEVIRLGLVDGTVRSASDELVTRLLKILKPCDVVLTTWRYDGHGDHEATAWACLRATERLKLPLIELPVWAWHWATPCDQGLPWHRARLLSLDDLTIRRKVAAVQAFQTQLLPDASTGRPPVLPPSMLQRAARRFEVLFV